MPAIASTAGVSVQTVYKAFGNKARLAKAMFDVAMAGDDEPVPMLQRASLDRGRDEPDARTKLRLYGEFLAEVAPRHVPVQLVIRDAATSDPEVQVVWAELQAERLKGMTLFAQALHDDGHLRPEAQRTRPATSYGPAIPQSSSNCSSSSEAGCRSDRADNSPTL